MWQDPHTQKRQGLAGGVEMRCMGALGVVLRKWKTKRRKRRKRRRRGVPSTSVS